MFPARESYASLAARTAWFSAKTGAKSDSGAKAFSVVPFQRGHYATLTKSKMDHKTLQTRTVTEI